MCWQFTRDLALGSIIRLPDLVMCLCFSFSLEICECVEQTQTCA